MRATVLVWALGACLGMCALADPVNVIYQHNPNLEAGVHYRIFDPPDNRVTILAGVAGQTFQLEATLEDNGVYQGPGDINRIEADPDAGPVEITIVGHNGHEYGARDVGTIDLDAPGVEGAIGSMKLSGNLATVDVVAAASMSGVCEVGDLDAPDAGMIVHDISVDCFTARLTCRSLANLHAGSACWTNPTMPWITIAGDFGGLLRLEGPSLIRQIVIAGTTTGTVEAYGVVYFAIFGNVVAAPARVELYGFFTPRLELNGGLAAGASVVLHGDLYQGYVSPHEDPPAELDGILHVLGHCDLLSCAANVRGTVDIDGDLGELDLQSGCSGILSADLLVDRFVVGSPETPVGLTGTLALMGSYLPDGNVYGDVTGRIEVGENWSGTLISTGKLLNKANNPVEHGGGIAIDGWFAGTAENPARIVFEKGLGGEGSVGGEFCTVDFDGYDAEDRFGPYAEIVLVEQVYSGNAPEASLFETTFCVGDMDNQADVDFDDLGPFVMALSGPASYADAFPGLAESMTYHADCNCDGVLDFDDIPAFTARLGQPCEGCGAGEEQRLAAGDLASAFLGHVSATRHALLRSMIGQVAARQSQPARRAYWLAVRQHLGE